MNLSIEKLLQTIRLPKRYFDSEFDISEKFQEESDVFFSLIEQCNGEEFDREQRDQIIQEFPQVIKSAKSVSNYILKIFEAYGENDFKNAQELMDNLMLLLKDDIFIGAIDDMMHINDGGENWYFRIRNGRTRSFFRVRAVEGESDIIGNNSDELFHIPYSKRAFSNNERFSLAGFPSLYLSTMLPLAWQECHYPPKYYFSEYHYSYEKSSDFNFLLLYSPFEIFSWGLSEIHNNFSLWLKVITRYLKTYPLIMACSFVNLSSNATFKQEYIIPQMLMQWVYRNKSAVVGIEYFSCIDNLKETSEWCAYNIAMPATPPYDDNKYSMALREAFTWTSPTYFNIPIFDKNSNKEDREFLYKFISDIWALLNRCCIPSEYNNVLIQMITLSSAVLNILESPENTDMQLILHTLYVCQDDITQMKNLHLEQDIKARIKKDKNFQYDDEKLAKISDALTKIYAKFFTENSSNSVEKIIKTYENLCWNF